MGSVGCCCSAGSQQDAVQVENERQPQSQWAEIPLAASVLPASVDAVVDDVSKKVANPPSYPEEIAAPSAVAAQAPVQVEEHPKGEDHGKSTRGSARLSNVIGKPFPKRPAMCKLPVELWKRLEDLFHKMDGGQNAVTREDAEHFFKGSFGKLSTVALFNEVDVDKSGVITGDEFMNFWIQVKAAGYKDEAILEEVDEMCSGAAWVDWKDGRNTVNGSSTPFPKRPWMCRLSQSTWSKCETLFKKIDVNDTQVLTPDVVQEFFKKNAGGFSQKSTEAMFNEIDVQSHGTITAKDFMKFWVQVRGYGYKDTDISDELDILLEGGAWRDWKDGRKTTRGE